MSTPLPKLPGDLAAWSWQAEAGGHALALLSDGLRTRTYADDEAAGAIIEARALAAREAELGEAPARPHPAPQAAGYTPELVPLSLLDDNPYQPRTSYEAAAIAELAAAIRAEGLLQPPTGRRTPDRRVELAFGHRRKRAVEQLAVEDPARWGAMPVIIRALDDEAMARQAWKENRDRRDLTAYEEARAIEKNMAAFGWSQKMAAEKLGLDPATVSNKLRLLRLPPAALAMLERGELSERQAIAILPLNELPPAAWEQPISAYLSTSWHRDTLTGLLPVMATMSADALRQRVDPILDNFAIKLEGQPWAKQVWDLPETRCGTCKDCAIRLKSTNRCPDAACMQAKQAAWLRQKSAAAAEAAKLPAVAIGEYGSYDSLGTANLAQLRAEAKRRNCGNLGVAYAIGNAYFHKKVEGHKDCGIVCAHGKGQHCRCLKALAKEGEGGLSDAEKTQRAEKKQAKVAYKEPAERVLSEALAAVPVGIMRLMFQHINAYAMQKLGDDVTPDRLAQALAVVIVKEQIKYEYDYQFSSAAKVREKLEQMLGGLAITPPWAEPAPAPTPPPPDAESLRTKALQHLVDYRELAAGGIAMADHFLFEACAIRDRLPDGPTRAALAGEIDVARAQVREARARQEAEEAAPPPDICAQKFAAITAALDKIEARWGEGGPSAADETQLEALSRALVDLVAADEDVIPLAAWEAAQRRLGQLAADLDALSEQREAA